MQNVVFSFESYTFSKLHLDTAPLEHDSVSMPIQLNWEPSGRCSRKEGTYELNLEFTAQTSEGTIFLKLHCTAQFRFIPPFDGSIPDFFYSNSLAILYPYIRAMVSTLTLQANVRPIVLPTLNLGKLGCILQKQTKID